MGWYKMSQLNYVFEGRDSLNSYGYLFEITDCLEMVKDPDPSGIFKFSYIVVENIKFDGGMIRGMNYDAERAYEVKGKVEYNLAPFDRLLSLLGDEDDREYSSNIKKLLDDIRNSNIHWEGYDPSIDTIEISQIIPLTNSDPSDNYSYHSIINHPNKRERELIDILVKWYITNEEEENNVISLWETFEQELKEMQGEL